MVSCNAVNFMGLICGKDATDSSYFWYFDAKQRVDHTFHLCQEHSNIILNELLHSEQAHTQIIDKLYQKVESLRNQLNKGSTIIEEREKIRQAKAEGLPPPKFKNVETLKKEINTLYEKIKKFKELKRKVRNHTCRFCDYPLKEPDDENNQIGNKFSHADFHSGFGYGRAWNLFHTECGISWLLSKVKLDEKELKYVRPKLTGQGVLFE